MFSLGHRAGRAVGIAAISAAGAIAIGSMSQAAANADTFVPLPNGVARSGDLTLSRTGESATISPSLAANGMGRTAWVSGTVTVNAPKLRSAPAGPNNGPVGEADAPGSNGTSTDGAAATLSTGYIIGCQVNITGFTGGISATISATPSLSGSLSIPVSAGHVVFALIDHRDLEHAGKSTISYSDVQLQIQSCGGYAQARAFSTIETTGNNHEKLNLYGQPFSIG